LSVADFHRVLDAVFILVIDEFVSMSGNPSEIELTGGGGSATDDSSDSAAFQDDSQDSTDGSESGESTQAETQEQTTTDSTATDTTAETRQTDSATPQEPDTSQFSPTPIDRSQDTSSSTDSQPTNPAPPAPGDVGLQDPQQSTSTDDSASLSEEQTNVAPEPPEPDTSEPSNPAPAEPPTAPDFEDSTQTKSDTVASPGPGVDTGDFDRTGDTGREPADSERELTEPQQQVFDQLQSQTDKTILPNEVSFEQSDEQVSGQLNEQGQRVIAATQLDSQTDTEVESQDVVFNDGRAELSDEAQREEAANNIDQQTPFDVTAADVFLTYTGAQLKPEVRRQLQREQAAETLTERTGQDVSPDDLVNTSGSAFAGPLGRQPSGFTVETGTFQPEQTEAQAEQSTDSPPQSQEELVQEAANETDFSESEVRDIISGDTREIQDFTDNPTEDPVNRGGQTTSAPAPDQNQALLSPDPDELSNPVRDRQVFRELQPELEAELGVTIERQDVNLNEENGEISASLTNRGRDKVQEEQGEEFGDSPLGDDYLRDAGQFIDRNVIDPVAEKSGSVVGSGVEFVAGENAGENAEAVTEGTVNVTGSLLNIPNTAAGLIEIGEFIGEGAAETVQGDAGEYADKTGEAAEAAITGFADYAQENPYRTAGQVGGSLLASSAIIGGAYRLSSTSGQATALAIQPGEEIAGIAGNQALARTGSGLTRLGTRLETSGNFDVSGKAVRRTGQRTEQSAEVLFPDNEPLIFSEEAGIRTARGVKNRVQNTVGNARDTFTTETELTPTPRQQVLIDQARPGTQTEAGTDTTQTPGAQSEVGAETEDILDATTTPRETETEAQQEDPPAYFPSRETETETGPTPDESNIIRQRSDSGSDLGTQRLPEGRSNVRELLADESASLEFRNQRQRGEQQQDPTQPEIEPSQDDLLSGSPRDRISDDVTQRNIQQRRQNQGDFEGTRDPVGEAESRRQQAQQQEVTQGREFEGRSEVTRAEVGTGLESTVGTGVAPFQRPEDTVIPGTDQFAGTQPDTAVRPDVGVDVRADTQQDVALDQFLDVRQEFETEQEQETELESETETEFETEFELETEQEQETEIEVETEAETEAELFRFPSDDNDKDAEQPQFGGDSNPFGTDFLNPLTGGVLETNLNVGDES
jgi:hypothetical protein